MGKGDTPNIKKSKYTTMKKNHQITNKEGKRKKVLPNSQKKNYENDKSKTIINCLRCKYINLPNTDRMVEWMRGGKKIIM